MDLYKKEIGVEKLLTDDPKELLMKRWRYPTLSVHSIGPKGQQSSASIIPASVSCCISARIVPDQHAEEVFQHIKNHLEEKFESLQTCNLIDIEMSGSGEWWLADPKNEFFKAAEESMEAVWNRNVIYSREGGTIPITHRLERTLNAPALHLPLGQCTDAHHLHDERIRVENLMKGKLVMKEFFRRVGKISSAK